MPVNQHPDFLISVVLCTYNGAQYLQEQIASILAQDYTNVELVIVDDCSTDATWTLLHQWQNRYPEKIRIFQNQENQGLNKNFTKAISLAKGAFIAIADQDDIWLRDKLNKSIQPFENKEVVLTYTTSISIKDGIEVPRNPAELCQLFSGNDTRKVVMFPTVAGHDMVFRAMNGLQPLHIPEGIPIYDWWIVIKATCMGQVVAIDSPGVKHRLHETNAYYNESHEEGVQIDNTVAIFRRIASLPDLRKSDAHWVSQMADELEKHGKTHKGKFDLRLFWHVFKNRKIIFYHIKRPSILRTQVAVWKKCFEMAKW